MYFCLEKFFNVEGLEAYTKDRNLQRRVFKISLRLGTQGRLPCQRNKSYCNSYTLFKRKKKMKERIKNPWLRWPFPKPKNLEQWWWLFTIGAISVTFLYIVFFSIITQP